MRLRRPCRHVAEKTIIPHVPKKASGKMGSSFDPQWNKEILSISSMKCPARICLRILAGK
jgi:hypothetical protein